MLRFGVSFASCRVSSGQLSAPRDCVELMASGLELRERLIPSRFAQTALFKKVVEFCFLIVIAIRERDVLFYI